MNFGALSAGRHCFSTLTPLSDTLARGVPIYASSRVRSHDREGHTALVHTRTRHTETKTRPPSSNTVNREERTAIRRTDSAEIGQRDGAAAEARLRAPRRAADGTTPSQRLAALRQALEGEERESASERVGGKESACASGAARHIHKGDDYARVYCASRDRRCRGPRAAWIELF